MPVHYHRLKDRVPDRQHLLNELIDEWKHPREDDADRPDIIVLHSDSGWPVKQIRLIVIWDKWQGIAHQDRSDIILDAYQTVADPEPEDLLGVSLVLGLTRAESTGMDVISRFENI